MSIDPLRLFKCLAEETRLMMTLLISREQELCVCELTHALEQSQPKVSRHLAELRRCGILADRRDAQWIYYRLEPGLPAWVLPVLEAAAEGRARELERVGERLAQMGNRPERRAALC